MIPTLENAWLEAIEEVAAQSLGSWNAHGTALATEVRALSETYTQERDSLRRQEALRAARLKFFLPRDLPKVEFPLAELRRKGAFPAPTSAPALPAYLEHPSPEPRMHVLDLGAGYGTTTFGLARYLARSQSEKLRVVVDAVDQDEFALRTFRMLADAMGKKDSSLPVLEIHTRVTNFTALKPSAKKYSFILLGLSLNEIASDAAAQAEYLGKLAQALTDDGTLVVLEPALKETARHLQDLGTAFRTSESQLAVVGPCPGVGACPLLLRPRDWCHEDLDIDLPAALQPIARAAGLRFQGLSFAYLTLSKLRPRASNVARVVGGPIASKGQREWHLCRAAEETPEKLTLTTLRLNHRDAEAHPLADALRRGVEVELGIDDAQVVAAKDACRLGREGHLVRVEQG